MTGKLALTVVLFAGAWARPASQTDAAQPRPAAARPAPYAHREDFLHFVLRRINPTGSDWGAWIEERRQRLLEATVTSRYFWHSAAMTLVAIVSMLGWWLEYAATDRKLWVAVELMADFWNHDQHSRYAARSAIEKYNQHVAECNRVIEAQASGRPMPAAVESSDQQSSLERLAAKAQALETENARLAQQLKAKDAELTEFGRRIEAVAATVAANGAGQSAPDVGTQSSLIARINQLEQQLDAERQKNRNLRGA